MNPQEVAFGIWQYLFNRPVHQQTTDEIYAYAVLCVASVGGEGRITLPSLLDQIRSLPPTYDEVALTAWNIWSSGSDASVQLPADQCWYEAVQVVWRGRGE